MSTTPENGSSELAMPRRYRKTALVEAIQFIKDKSHPAGTNLTDVIAFIGGDHGERYIVRPPSALGIVTLEGPLWIAPGYYVLRGPAGECWPVREDIFEATYELVED